jgi:two-component system phosphate regulon sensor histidine kinase PhoR
LPASGPERTALLILRDETDARRAERTRVDFLANASHELRTPLASLVGFIETLRGHARTDEAAREKFLRIMQGQAERMSRLIDDLMNLSRIELNEHVPPGGEADVTQAALDVLDAVAPLAAEQGVRLVSELPPVGEAVIAGDRDQVIQVMQNLVDNALKYTPAGGEVQVRAEAGVLAADRPERGEGRLWLLSPAHDARQRYVALSVKDAGPGIEREHLPRLAERFYRVEGQKSGERAGTGLGLALVKHIVNRHRGGLLVESRPGEGALFTVFLPQGAPPGPTL